MKAFWHWFKMTPIVAMGFVCLTLLATTLICVLLHLSTWLPAVDKFIISLQAASASLPPAMVSLKEAADTSNMTSTETLNLVGSAVKLVDSVQNKVDALDLKRVNSVMDEMHNAVSAATQALTTVNAQVDSLGKQTSQTFKDINLKVGGIADNVNVTLVKLPPLFESGTSILKSGNELIVSTKQFIDFPMTTGVNDLDAIIKPAGLMTHDLQLKTHEWLFPLKQSKWMQFYKIMKGLSPLAQPTYYGFKLWKETQ